MINKRTMEDKNKKTVYGEKDKAWCPICFDELDCVEIYDGFGLIKRHEYKCFGCDKSFELKLLLPKP